MRCMIRFLSDQARLVNDFFENFSLGLFPQASGLFIPKTKCHFVTVPARLSELSGRFWRTMVPWTKLSQLAVWDETYFDASLESNNDIFFNISISLIWRTAAGVPNIIFVLSISLSVNLKIFSDQGLYHAVGCKPLFMVLPVPILYLSRSTISIPLSKTFTIINLILMTAFYVLLPAVGSSGVPPINKSGLAHIDVNMNHLCDWVYRSYYTALLLKRTVILSRKYQDIELVLHL